MTCDLSASTFRNEIVVVACLSTGPTFYPSKKLDPALFIRVYPVRPHLMFCQVNLDINEGLKNLEMKMKNDRGEIKQEIIKMLGSSELDQDRMLEIVEAK